MQNTLLLLPSTNRLQYQYQGLLFFFIGQFFQSQGTRETMLTGIQQTRMRSRETMSTGIQQTRMRSLSTPPVLSSSRTPLPLIRSASTSNIQDGQATRPVLLFQRPTEYTQGDAIQVFTDGSTDPNGSGSGIGLYYGREHPLNQSCWLPNVYNSGLAEVIAARTGLDTLIRWQNYRGENVDLNTDYLSTIHWLQSQNPDWAFADEFRRLRESAEQFPQGVLFRWVPGHEGIEGNERADSLARTGRLSQQSSSNSSIATSGTTRSQSLSAVSSSTSSDSSDSLETTSSSVSTNSMLTDQSSVQSSSFSRETAPTDRRSRSRSRSRSRRRSRSRSRHSIDSHEDATPRSVFIMPRNLQQQMTPSPSNNNNTAI